MGPRTSTPFVYKKPGFEIANKGQRGILCAAPVNIYHFWAPGWRGQFRKWCEAYSLISLLKSFRDESWKSKTCFSLDTDNVTHSACWCVWMSQLVGINWRHRRRSKIFSRKIFFFADDQTISDHPITHECLNHNLMSRILSWRKFCALCATGMKKSRSFGYDPCNKVQPQVNEGEKVSLVG